MKLNSVAKMLTNKGVEKGCKDRLLTDFVALSMVRSLAGHELVYRACSFLDPASTIRSLIY
jgi:hypothetical protein